MSRRTRRSRRRPLLVLVTLLLAAGAFVLWTRSGDPAPAAAETPTPTTTSAAAPSATVPSSEASSDVSSEDPDAGTEEEADEEPSSRPTATRSAPEPEQEDDGGLTAVAVSLSYTGYDAAAGAVVAGGYAADVVEEDATCTLVLRRGGVELRGESLGTANVTTTDCGEVRVGGDALTSGTWEAVLSYTSDTSVGESSVGEVVVP
jgi:cytoskeletal protein RodZ